MNEGHDRVVARRGRGLLTFSSFWEKLTFCFGNRQSCASNEDTPPRRREVLILTLSVPACAKLCTGSAASVEAVAHLFVLIGVVQSPPHPEGRRTLPPERRIPGVVECVDSTNSPVCPLRHQPPNPPSASSPFNLSLDPSSLPTKKSHLLGSDAK